MRINSFDIDGVIYMGEERGGVYPGPHDIIITGRSYEEAEYTEKMLKLKQISNKVYYSPIPFELKTRELSGTHKATVINNLRANGIIIDVHYEDDPIQAEIIRGRTGINVVLLQHDLTEKENVWHGPQDSNPL